MKRKLLYALPMFLVLATGCLKNNNDDVTPVVQPQGTFSGKFTRLRLRVINAKQVVDTTIINLTLQLNGSNFKVTGDTTLHAGSTGTFSYNSNYIQYNDLTIPANNTTPAANLPKIHLSGVFQYQYNGTNLAFTAQNDTLLYYYDLKK